MQPTHPVRVKGPPESNLVIGSTPAESNLVKPGLRGEGGGSDSLEDRRENLWLL
jgi:hypothetical protein